MLTFYYHPLSPIARRVWLALLEKEIPFEAKTVNLTGEQFKPEFLALNPFHHVPVVVDQGLTLIESLAILDYLEANYPQTALMPDSPAEIAKTRMVQMIVVNELTTKIPRLGAASDLAEIDLAPIDTALKFISEKLGDNPYFGGNSLSIADIIAGSTLPLICRLGISLQSYPNLEQWYQQISQRPSWQQTEPSEAEFQLWRRWIKRKMERRS